MGSRNASNVGTDGSQYDADYFLHGRESGKSLYENYRWIPELTIPMAQRIAEYLGIRKEEPILDFGCSRGYLVRAFRELGYEAYGVDVSQWAIDNCDETVRDYVTCASVVPPGMAWVIAKDVLEHVPDLEKTIGDMMTSASIGVFAVVPLGDEHAEPYESSDDGTKGCYVIPEYELDVTHLHRLSLRTWAALFNQAALQYATDMYTELRYRIPGIKDNYYKPGWEKGNGFITARRAK